MSFFLLASIPYVFSQTIETNDDVARIEYRLSTLKNDAELYKSCFDMLPDLSACKEIFIGNYAYDHYDNVLKLKEILSKGITNKQTSTKTFNFIKLIPVDLKSVESFVAVAYLEKAQQITRNNINPKIIFYRAYANKTSHYDDLDDWFFVNIKGEWVMIVEPWRLEKTVSDTRRVDENALFKVPVGSDRRSNDAAIGGNVENSRVDASTLYGKPGGSATGLALNVAGWGMGARPQLNDDSNESGRIVFEIIVDDTGEIINIKTKDATVSQPIVDIYKKAVSRMKLVPKSENVPKVSKGTITFNIKSR